MTRAPDGREQLLEVARRHRTPRPASEEPPRDRSWLYAADQFELATAARLLRESRAALRHVDYAENGGQVAPRSWFRHPSARPVEVCGTEVDGAVEAVAGEPAAIVVDDPTGWEASLDGRDWRPAVARATPHTGGEPIVVVPLQRVGDHFALDAPVLGRVVIEAVGRPVLGTGETVGEARAADAEARHDLDERTPGTWVSRHELGLRFAVITGDVRSAHVEARVRPSDEPGAFACSDDRLTDIWAVAVATLHTSAQRLMLDGVKRDRLPWQGDLASTTLANAYSLADGELVRDTLVALGRPRHGHVNGIADYSLWWLVNLRSYQLHFGDAFLRDEAPAIRRFVAGLLEQVDDDGLLRPVAGDDAFTGAGPEAVFLDWGAPAIGSAATAFQLLWYWGLHSAALVLDDAELAARALRLHDLLLERGWSARLGRWTTRLDGGDDPAPSYPNVIAVLAGIRPPSPSPAVAAVIRDGEVGTPFMRTHALTALRLLGEGAVALGELERRWGAQLDAGALTFWEDFAHDGTPDTAMYGRPFGRSLCHAWASGPAALLPQLLLGLEPTAPGWSEFVIDDHLGDLDWAAATVATPQGPITVIADRRELRAWIPAGSTLLLGDARITGPAVLERARHRTDFPLSATPPIKETP